VLGCGSCRDLARGCCISKRRGILSSSSVFGLSCKTVAALAVTEEKARSLPRSAKSGCTAVLCFDPSEMTPMSLLLRRVRRDGLFLVWCSFEETRILSDEEAVLALEKFIRLPRTHSAFGRLRSSAGKSYLRKRSPDGTLSLRRYVGSLAREEYVVWRLGRP
jgi:hypothetical protein